MFRKCIPLLFLNILTISVDSYYVDNRIIGGQDVTIEEAPWQIALLLNNEFICGGSIYSELFVITAAHCVVEKPEQQFQIRAGSTNYNDGGSLISIAKTLCNEDYNSTRKINDIAMLLLKKPLKFSESIQAIRLAEKSPDPWSWATITGWGRRSNNLSPSTTLQVAQLQVLSHFWCLLEYYPVIFDDKFCAYNVYSHACQGDSGDPLVLDGRLVGIVSFGQLNCGGSSVYVDVVKMRQWIEKAVEILN
ncbi:trypsin-like [Drosophila nasuta]|uniref:trypsin-like n=1 Tax=Drosophila nasuta TaxID=42062 RepID=UPI00295F5296|nr:trypsin-like [Drosophila nasuta]